MIEAFVKSAILIDPYEKLLKWVDYENYMDINDLLGSQIFTGVFVYQLLD